LKLLHQVRNTIFAASQTINYRPAGWVVAWLGGGERGGAHLGGQVQAAIVTQLISHRHINVHCTVWPASLPRSTVTVYCYLRWTVIRQGLLEQGWGWRLRDQPSEHHIVLNSNDSSSVCRLLWHLHIYICFTWVSTDRFVQSLYTSSNIADIPRDACMSVLRFLYDNSVFSRLLTS